MGKVIEINPRVQVANLVKLAIRNEIEAMLNRLVKMPKEEGDDDKGMLCNAYLIMSVGRIAGICGYYNKRPNHSKELRNRNLDALVKFVKEEFLEGKLKWSPHEED